MRSSLTSDYFLQVVGNEIDPDLDRSTEIADLLKRSEAIILAFTSPTGRPSDGIWVDEICSSIQMDMILRVWYNRRGLASEAMGPENQSFVAPGGLMILPAEKEQLEKIKNSSEGSSTLGTLRTFRPSYRPDPFDFF